MGFINVFTVNMHFILCQYTVGYISRTLFVSSFLFAIMISSFLRSRVAAFWSFLVMMLKKILLDHTVCYIPMVWYYMLHTICNLLNSDVFCIWNWSQYNSHQSYLFLHLGYGNFCWVFILFVLRCIFYCYWRLLQWIFKNDCYVSTHFLVFKMLYPPLVQLLELLNQLCCHQSLLWHKPMNQIRLNNMFILVSLARNARSE